VTEPLAALAAPVVPVDPGPGVADRLRSRLEHALSLPEGVDVTTLEFDLGLETPPHPTARNRVVPYLCVAGARDALAWYAEALGASVVGEPILMPDGRLGHAELDLGGAVVFLSDESPESHVAAPDPAADATVSLVLELADVDAAVERVAAAGGRVERPAVDHPYGRNAVVRDPFGHRWMLSGPVAGAGAPATDRLRQGDVVYVSLWVTDADRAADFFGSVLGWSIEAAPPGWARQIEGRDPHHGLMGGHSRPTLFLCFAVDDLPAALDRVRAAGGSAGEPEPKGDGQVADCVDDQGCPFALYQGPPGALRPPRNGGGAGDVCYITMQVVDSARTRAFYGAVLGWTFEPGRVDDGWGPRDVAPMVGLHGGHDETTIVPMYRVDDAAAAVARVRAAGGTATDPERQPYGVSAECTDDQGTHFYLGQLE